MRTAYDFSPLSRSSIGFDPLFNLLENAARLPATETWPPYDIEKLGQDRYRLTMALAGLAPEQLNLTMEPNLLIVSGQAPAEDEVQYLHRGIPASSFERRFELADYVQVQSARLDNGLLTIELVREIPDAMKPRRIEVQAPSAVGTGEPAPQQVKHRKQAA
jgi:molecular chaperone IbpA